MIEAVPLREEAQQLEQLLRYGGGDPAPGAWRACVPNSIGCWWNSMRLAATLPERHRPDPRIDAAAPAGPNDAPAAARPARRRQWGRGRPGAQCRRGIDGAARARALFGWRRRSNPIDFDRALDDATCDCERSARRRSTQRVNSASSSKASEQDLPQKRRTLSSGFSQYQHDPFGGRLRRAGTGVPP
jgi:hypothetical protein